MKIKSARITALPNSFLDPMPQVYVTLEDDVEQLLYEYYPDEISFSPEEFIGLTVKEAITLKFNKDQYYLKNETW